MNFATKIILIPLISVLVLIFSGCDKDPVEQYVNALTNAQKKALSLQPMITMFQYTFLR